MAVYKHNAKDVAKWNSSIPLISPLKKTPPEGGHEKKIHMGGDIEKTVEGTNIGIHGDKGDVGIGLHIGGIKPKSGEHGEHHAPHFSGQLSYKGVNIQAGPRQLQVGYKGPISDIVDFAKNKIINPIREKRKERKDQNLEENS
jgi:hypothetical protein